MRSSDGSSDVCSSDLENADVDLLLDPDARPISKFTKFWAAPLVWMAARQPDDTVARTVAPGAREEVRHKLSNFIRARWFAPPFGGEGFTNLLLDALEAMETNTAGPPLIPEGHPLRTEEHTSELQSLMRISYAVFCLKK